MHKQFATRMIAAFALVAVSLVAFVSPAPVRAATVVANAFFDRADGSCATTGMGECTLREAVIFANANPGTTIQLLAGTYNRTIGPTIPPQENVTGVFRIRANITIVGAGQASSIIDGNAVDKLFDVSSGITASITGITVRNGKSQNGIAGGGIANAGNLTITDSTVTGNNGISGLGAGVFNSGTLTLNGVSVSNNTGSSANGTIYSNGTLTMRNSIVEGNAGTGIIAVSNSGTGNSVESSATITNSTVRNNQGSGIQSSVTLVVTDTVIEGNTGGDRGGGIANGCKMTLLRVTIRGNSSDVGGGISNGASASCSTTFVTPIIQDSIISGNAATLDGGAVGGGGIWNAGALIIDNSIIGGPGMNGNRSVAKGGGISNTGSANLTIRNGSRIVNNVAQGTRTNEGGGGIHSIFASVTTVDTTIDSNSAVIGGGIFLVDYGTLTLTNTTVSNNTATIEGGGIAARNSASGTLTNSTVSGNSAPAGGGISNGRTAQNYSGASSLMLDNTTVAANTSGVRNVAGTLRTRNSIFANTGANCTGTVTSGDYNLSSDATCATLTQPHDLNVAPAPLGPLADNGGPTRTHTLLEGNAAVDAGGTSANGCPATDQRGVPRPQGRACDIGAFEGQLRAQPEPRASITPVMLPPLPQPAQRDTPTPVPGSMPTPPTPNAAPLRR